MLEIPETFALAKQINATLKSKVIKSVKKATNKHKFCWFSGDEEYYHNRLVGKTFLKALSNGSFLDIQFDDSILTICDAITPFYSTKPSDKFQLLIEFADETFLSFKIGLYGGIFVHNGDLDSNYYINAKKCINPLDEKFDFAYFKSLYSDETKELSCKAFLATNQRIPGLGNGVLQDILFFSKLHPKRIMGTLTKQEFEVLFSSIKRVLKEMADLGGRDTEKDLFEGYGKYKTRLSKKTLGLPCEICSTTIVKESFLGGTIYYCPTCQKKI